MYALTRTVATSARRHCGLPAALLTFDFRIVSTRASSSSQSSELDSTISGCSRSTRIDSRSCLSLSACFMKQCSWRRLGDRSTTGTQDVAAVAVELVDEQGFGGCASQNLIASLGSTCRQSQVFPVRSAVTGAAKA